MRLPCILQIGNLDSHYTDGGLPGYVLNAKQLLDASAKGKNPFDFYRPEVPQGENLTYGDPEFEKMEKIGVEAAKDAVFILVAGGLGERLGYSVGDAVSQVISSSYQQRSVGFLIITASHL